MNARYAQGINPGQLKPIDEHACPYLAWPMQASLFNVYVVERPCNFAVPSVLCAHTVRFILNSKKQTCRFFCTCCVDQQNAQILFCEQCEGNRSFVLLRSRRVTNIVFIQQYLLTIVARLQRTDIVFLFQRGNRSA